MAVKTADLSHDKFLIFWKMYKGEAGLMYDNETRKYLNISAEYEIESHDEFHNRTFQTNLTKNVRPCKHEDFDQLGTGEDFEAMTEN